MTDSGKTLVVKPSVTRYYCMLLLGIFVVYYICLPPDIVWGDSAKLTNYAIENRFSGNIVGGHDLHNFLGWLALKVIPGSPSFVLNFLSTVFSILTLGLYILILKQLKFCDIVIFFSILILAFSHMFWFHSEICESYMLNLFFLGLIIYYFLMFEEKMALKYLLLSSFFLGISFSNHVLNFIFFPFFLVYFYLKHGIKIMGIYLFSTMVSLIPYFSLMHIKTGSLFQQLVGSHAMVTTHYFNLSKVVKETLMFAIYSAYQFQFINFIILLYGIFHAIKSRIKYFSFFLVLVMINIMFPAAYMYQRQFNLYLTAFFILSLFFASGLQQLLKKYDKKIIVMMLVSLLLQICVYLNFDKIVKYSLVNPIKIREFNYRNNLEFFFNPVKRYCNGPQNLKRDVEKIIPDKSAVFADFTILSVIKYYRFQENWRQDLELYSIDKYFFSQGFLTMQKEIEDCLTRNLDIYFLDGNRNYYFLDDVEKYYRIEKTGHFYKISKL